MPVNHKAESHNPSQNPEIPANHLLQVFQEYTRSNEEGAAPYDFFNMPPIDGDILNRLRQKVNDIPPLPEIWHQVQNILNDPESAPSDLGRIVEQDPILSAHLLRICNSSAYRASNTKSVTSATLAIARLGMDQTATFIMESVVLNAGSQDLMSKPEVRHMWYHSLAISMICRILADASRVITSSEIGLLGLLHDIGKMVILHAESETKLTQLRATIESGVPSLKAESEILGYTHIDAGMVLALHWKLPTKVSQIISFHHHPSSYAPNQWPEDSLTAMMFVHTAHIILQSLDQAEQTRGLWSSCQRTHEAEVADLLHMPLQLTQHYQHDFAQIERELGQLKCMFPDLFPQEVEDLQAAQA